MSLEEQGRTFEGDLVGTGQRFAMVVSRFNDFITSRLLQGARDALLRHGVQPKDIDVVWVPGACELPLAVQKMARTKDYNAIVCLGAVIRGATSHFEHVSTWTARGLSQITLETECPVSFGVLTTETIEQAIERAGCKAGNKGAEAALAALEMARLCSVLDHDLKANVL